ncbi:MAG: hypothetical protein HW421_1995 [Ignavibacteria bacterium]|nr:hypothetical protein [Ignavibacteria bacterium]
MKKKDISQNDNNSDENNLNSQSRIPFVFISHDTRDAKLAEIFSELIRKVSSGMLTCFISSDKKGEQGIEFGQEWYPTIIKKLNEATDIVALLTSNSIDRPWILFETGIAKGNKNKTTIFGIALGISLNKVTTSGPFAQFQNSSDDEDDLLKVIFHLCKQISGLNPDKEIATILVKEFITKKNDFLKNRPIVKKEDEKEESVIIKLFEELKMMNQDLTFKIQDRLEPEYRSRKMKFHPKYLHDLIQSSKEINPETVFLIMISFFKEEMPWIYSLGLETYNLLKKSNSEKEINDSFKELERILLYTIRGPLKELFRIDKEFYYNLEEFHFEFKRIYLEIINSKQYKNDSNMVDKNEKLI